MSHQRIRVAIVFGGRSGEHAVSAATAAGVLGAIDRGKYDVVPVGITRSGEWVLAADDAGALEIRDGHVPEVDATGDGRLLVPFGSGPAQLVVLSPGAPPNELAGVDVVLPLLHGPFGEDGTIQGMLELAGVPYVGSGVLASAAGMDKHYMKVVLAGAGLPVGPYTVLTPSAWRRDRAACLDQVASLGLPVFVKPARAGSSIGITRVESLDRLVEAIEEAQRHDPKVIVEAAITGREIEVAVLEGRGDEPPRTTMPGEIVVTNAEHGFYDYEAKYFDSAGVDLRCPADLPPGVADEARRLAAEAFDALGCEGLARVDFFYTPSGTLVVNEINTMPGFTPFSMFPLLWERSGVAYPELIDELLQLALARPTGLR
ncbi:D-alanine/D-alanine ligase [Beutenbergia cavernae DSM 12333]|uniref:D-alanine--D-alanine ligase n=1 Tax=Beutenbergia cavernae (strain ATCC BAA-8 / DSM 12333 / CCUG 43141 / JCM 11478 / NBRC 16432 / NCIMB 13614 / HKI 0122) TaxID=471853 RepID=C5C3F2_BEUC1|nr:D-alanine--D-alanine ligase family protein [Beutenbergia cavernae]ACQ79851.1 D-alanine/D-alanine ligase [Beutenbergia cavernae DSM 12333]